MCSTLLPKRYRWAKALLKTGDVIRLDLPARRLDMLVGGNELIRRREAWSAPAPRFGEGGMWHRSDFLKTGFGAAVDELDSF